MEHTVLIAGHDLYKEWGLVPKERLHVAQPEVKTSYVDIPGSDGSLDYSTILTGKIRYGQRTGSWSFWLRPKEKWPEIYREILAAFHGQEVKAILTDDSDHFYSGRITVNAWKSNEKASEITLDYNFDPYRYVVSGSGDRDWLWNDLFDNVIYYGRFDVAGEMARNLINPGAVEISPTIICSEPMMLSFDGKEHELMRGENKNGAIILSPGNNKMTFKGNGRVVVDYPLGLSL